MMGLRLVVLLVPPVPRSPWTLVFLHRYLETPTGNPSRDARDAWSAYHHRPLFPMPICVYETPMCDDGRTIHPIEQGVNVESNRRNTWYGKSGTQLEIKHEKTINDQQITRFNIIIKIKNKINKHQTEWIGYLDLGKIPTVPTNVEYEISCTTYQSASPNRQTLHSPREAVQMYKHET